MTSTGAYRLFPMGLVEDVAACIEQVLTWEAIRSQDDDTIAWNLLTALDERGLAVMSKPVAKGEERP